MQGVFRPTYRGIVAALCAVATASLAPAAPSYDTRSDVDFPSVSETGVEPIADADDVDDALITLLLPDSEVETGDLLHDEVWTELADSTGGGIGTEPTGGGLGIDAGEVEVTDVWDNHLDTPGDWNAPEEDPAHPTNAGPFHTATAADAGSGEFASSVSVIPLPAAIPSAAATLGLMAGVWIVRRIRGKRSTY